LSAPSIASEPEFRNITLSIGSGRVAVSISDSRTTGSLKPIAPVGPIRDALDYRARFPDGRIGSDPAQASPEKGQRIIDAAVPALLRDVEAFANEPLPS